jgi:ribosomal protein S24E
MKKLKETPSPLINRTRVEYEIEHFQKSTPKKDDLKAQLAKELKTQEDTIHVKHIFSHFGSSKSKIIADIYKTKEDLKKKKVAEGEQPAAPAQPVEKKEVAPKEEKKEAPKEEKK